MKVSPASPFRLIYSLFQHEYLGYLFESFVVQVDQLGKLTYSHQNISSKNAKEFASGLDEKDYTLIKEMDAMQQDAVVKHFYKKKIKTNEFFLKIYDKEKGNKLLQQEIAQYLERRRSHILPLLPGKEVFEMGSDGEPTWKQLEMDEEKATVLFHFRKNEENTHYFPTIKHRGEKLEFQYQNAYIVCNEPAWMALGNKMISFEKNVDGNKVKPFLNKKFIVIPKNLEETYYKKFVSQIVGSYDVYAKGFEIKTLNEKPVPVLTIQELATVQKDLFSDTKGSNGSDPEQGKLLIDLCFQYGEHRFAASGDQAVNVKLNKKGEDYTFYRINRNSNREKSMLNLVRGKGLPINGSKLTLPKARAMEWITTHLSDLESEGFLIRQESVQKKYYLGRSEISIEVKENIDWFDIHAVVRFGEFEIPFKELRKYILKKLTEFTLPNGEIAVIPESWFTEYSELFAFSEDTTDQDVKLKKHHLALVQELGSSNLAKVSFDRKLQNLQDFDSIEEYEMPEHFKGKLRPYQKAGYNWLNFLQEYRFGGCLADDMGLGKTVQTLALLQNTVNQNKGVANLLVMPTSLVYNWEMEAKKFTPKLKVLVYTGTDRNKNVERFQKYDLVLTSYGIARLDVDLLSSYYFNYIILDESQAIKNPDSIIAKAVRRLNSKNKLILTGTPVENSTMDLWSQMSFINPGLLGGQSYFTKDFLIPIEKKKDEAKTQKLFSLIKPFVMRRDKSQVAKDLPEKVENVNFCTMSEQQHKAYDDAKDFYRNKILEQIEVDGVGKSQAMLLQGLTRLRQIANHPKLADDTYNGDSGKLEDVTYSLLNALGKGHKILVFSQFVKHLKLVEEYLVEQKIKYTYLDGSTRDRKEQVERFQNDDDYSIFLISLKAGGLGLNLTKADYVFILDPWWNPAAENQAIDRAHRIGQQNKVFTYKFIMKNTVEEKILKLQKNKLALAKNLISTEESFMKSLSKDDITSLLD